jgi:hypothetical protein
MYVPLGLDIFCLSVHLKSMNLTLFVNWLIDWLIECWVTSRDQYCKSTPQELRNTTFLMFWINVIHRHFRQYISYICNYMTILLTLIWIKKIYIIESTLTNQMVILFIKNRPRSMVNTWCSIISNNIIYISRSRKCHFYRWMSSI